MKIIVLSSRFPYPLEKGDKLRLFHGIKGLAQSHEIYLFSISEKEKTTAQLEALSKHGIRVYNFNLPFYKRLLLGIKSFFFSTKPIQSRWIYSLALERKLKKLVNEINPDVIFCQLPRMVEYCKQLSHAKVLDFMDAFSVSMKYRSHISKFPLNMFYQIEHKRMAKYENNIYKYFDKACVISEYDKEILPIPTKDNIEVIPNGVDVSYFNLTEKSSKYQLGFVGNMSYLPNEDAVNFIFTEIFPSFPDYQILISGASPPSRIKILNSEQFNITGWVDDIRDSYKDIYIFVAPLFKGTGQQNKILEAMAMGIPCITTTSVNKSIGGKDGRDILIADTKEEFIIQIKRLMNDKELYTQISKSANHLVCTNFTWEQHVNKLEKLFYKAIDEYRSK